jgi:peptidoglycan biosynthesis protein MviN/MurJ (putative lipid II flippase)
MGMSIAYLISMIVLVLASYFYLRKTIRLKIDWFAIGKIFIATLIFSAFALTLNSIFTSTILKLVTILVGALLYIVVLIPLKYYSANEIDIIRHLFSRFKFLRGKIDIIEKILLRKF